MSSPLILTLLAGSATFIGAIFGVLGQKPSNRLLGFLSVSPPGSCCLFR